MDDLDLRDIMLEATAEVQEIIRELLEELIEPHDKETIRETWMSAPEELRDQFANERPEEYRALMNALEERKGYK
jgi:hypothetical protein